MRRTGGIGLLGNLVGRLADRLEIVEDRSAITVARQKQQVE